MENNKRVRITVLLDDKTLEQLRAYGYQKFGTTNVSRAILAMVKENENKDRKNN